MTFTELLKKDYILLDGGFGTELIKKGLLPEEDTASAVFTHPQWVKEIHSSYIDAGSNIIFADTFGANREKLKNSPYTVEESIKTAIALARESARETDTLVALDVSTTGRLLVGEMTWDECYEVYKEVCVLGEKYGADLVALETFTDLKEARIALLAAKENTALPVIATLSFDENGTTMYGNTPASVALTLCALDVDAVGLNCSLGPDKLKNIVEDFLKYTDCPVIVKPNAGLPDLVTGEYSMCPEEFARFMGEFYENGVGILGGCCGTTPRHLKALKAELKKRTRGKRAPAVKSLVCGTGEAVSTREIAVIGERINPTGKKKFKEALENEDLGYILREGITQISAGAQILDVNVGHSEIDENKMMEKVILALQNAVNVPLQPDSTSSEVLETALRHYCGKAIINSVNGEEKSLNEILPLAKKYGAAVVGLTLDESGIPETAEERLKIAEKIINRARNIGIPEDDIIIDCLTITVSAKPDSAKVTLKALEEIKNRFGVKTALGVSNISFGLPSREVLNTAFLTAALERGLNLPIMNPNSPDMMSAVRSQRVLKAFDKGASEYIDAFAGVSTSAPGQREITLFDAIEKGLKKLAGELTEKALKEKAAQEIINGILIPALDKVGEDFEKGKIFLPQLIASADAAGESFAVLKRNMPAQKGESNGKIIIATVKGDVHDIGKNIVKTVLENYGYDVVDLGKDVAPEDVLKAQKETGAPLVGLSALMTTTLPAMEETVRLLLKECPECKIMVGGAVLTLEYAERIGAHFYAKDAKMSADIAKKTFS